MPITTQQNQYVQPTKKPAPEPKISWVKSVNDLYSKLDNSNSPIARMMKNMKKPIRI